MENKNCYLILAHRDPEHLKRLIYALDAPGFDIYVHVDKRMNVKTFGFEEYELKYGKLVPLKDRVKVYWGDFDASAHYNEKALLHYLDYGEQIAVFTEKDYDKIIASGKLFLRKAVTGTSDALMDLLDKRRESRDNT